MALLISRTLGHNDSHIETQKLFT